MTQMEQMSSVAGARYLGVWAPASWLPSIPQLAFLEQNNPGTPPWDIFSNVFFNSDNCNWNLAAACGPSGISLAYFSLSLLLLLFTAPPHQSSDFFFNRKIKRLLGEKRLDIIAYDDLLNTAKYPFQVEIKKLTSCFLLFQMISFMKLKTS